MASNVSDDEARLSLVGEEFKNKLVHLNVKVTVEHSDIRRLDHDISGVSSNDVQQQT